MNRRAVIRSIGLGTISGIAGCLSRESSPTAGQIDVDTQFKYPTFSGSQYGVTASSATELEPTPTPFQDLSTGERIELANAVHRARYVTGESPELLHSDRHLAPVSYKGDPYDVSISVADRFKMNEYGPNSDSDWIDPVDISVRDDGASLTIELSNELDTQLDVYHFGSPYFGVLVAVNQEAIVLDHDAYEENQYIQPSGIITTERAYGDEFQTKSLSPNGSMSEAYTFPEELSSDPTIWLSVRIGDDSIDMFGNRPILLTARITLEM